MQIRPRIKPRIDGHAQSPRLHHPAKSLCPHLSTVEMQEHRRSRAPHLTVGHADIADRTGLVRQVLPQPGLLQNRARAGGNGIGTTIEMRMLHRRQGLLIDHRRAHTLLRQQAGQRAPHRAGADHAHIRLDPAGHYVISRFASL